MPVDNRERLALEARDMGAQITTAEAATMLGVTRQAVLAITDRGELRVATKLANGQRLFRLRDVERLKAKRDKRTEEKK